MCLQLESARKLRWYDRDDLGPLVTLHTNEKLQLHAAVTALRQVLPRSVCNTQKL